MAEVSLDDKFCDGAPPPADPRRKYVIYYDASVKGLGLRVTQAAAKSFVLNYYTAGGTERRLTIGTFRDPWRTVAARKEALRLKTIIDQGGDPQGDKNTLRAAPTVADLIERWRAEHSPKNRASTRAENEELIRQWVLPELGSRRVAELRYVDIETWHRKIGMRTPYRANRALALLSKMLSLAVRWEWRADNPCRSIERHPEQRRYRYLSPDEIGRLVAVLAEYENRPVANSIRMLLLTGARTSEVVNATWDQFDLAAGIWTKPSAATKQKVEHRVPLSAPVRQLLSEMPRDGERLFPGLTQVYRCWGTICRRAGIEGARVHDLRHSYASILASGGQSLSVIGALFGHPVPSTTARYSHLFDDPLRAATERVGAIVAAAAATGAGADVVAMPERGRRR